MLTLRKPSDVTLAIIDKNNVWVANPDEFIKSVSAMAHLLGREKYEDLVKEFELRLIFEDCIIKESEMKQKMIELIGDITTVVLFDMDNFKKLVEYATKEIGEKGMDDFRMNYQFQTMPIDDRK